MSKNKFQTRAPHGQEEEDLDPGLDLVEEEPEESYSPSQSERKPLGSSAMLSTDGAAALAVEMPSTGPLDAIIAWIKAMSSSLFPQDRTLDVDDQAEKSRGKFLQRGKAAESEHVSLSASLSRGDAPAFPKVSGLAEAGKSPRADPALSRNAIFRGVRLRPNPDALSSITKSES